MASSFDSALHRTAPVRRTVVAANDHNIDKWLLIILLIAVLLRVTAFYALLGHSAFRAAIAFEYSIYLYYIIIAIKRSHLWIAGASVAFLLYLIMETYVFHVISKQPLNINAALSYGSILMALVFYEMSVSMMSFGKILSIFSVSYLFVYDVFWQKILAIAGPDSPLWLPSDGSRGVRMVMASSLAIYVFFLGIFSIRKQPVRSIFMIALASYAILLAQSRFATVALMIGFLSAMVGWLLPSIRKYANFSVASVFIIACCTSLYGLFDASWNPYSIFLSDNSGYARYLEYIYGSKIFDSRFLIGIGIPGSFDALQNYANPVRPLFISDLGVFGIALQFGLIFALLYVAACTAVIAYPSIRPGREWSLSMTIFYSAQVIAFSSFFTSPIFGSAGTILIALTVANWFAQSSHDKGTRHWAGTAKGPGKVPDAIG